jgi:hypothetical protein
MAKTTNILLPDGSTIQVPAWATETTLVAMGQQMQRTNVLTSEMLDGVKEMSDVDDEVIKAINNTINATTTNAETDLKQSKNQNGAIVGAVKAVNNTATFFGDSAKPMSSMVGALKSLSKNMDGPTGKGGLAKLTKSLKLEGFFKKFGGALDVAADVALAWAGWNAAKFEQFAEVQQKMIDSGSIFYDSAGEFDKLYEQSFRSGVTYNAFADTISNYGSTMTALGGNVSKGSKKFLGMFKQLSEVTDSMGDLGMQNAELMNQYAAYLEMARITGQIDSNSMEDQGKKLGQSFSNLVVESTALASLTKLSRNEVLAANVAAMSDVRLAAGTNILREQGLEDQAISVENISKQIAQIALAAEGPGKQAFENLGEAINVATMAYSRNIGNFTLEGYLDQGTLATLQSVAPGLTDTIATKIREGTLAGDGVQNFLINEVSKIDTTKRFSQSAEGYGKEIQGLQSTILLFKKDFKAVIGKNQAEIKRLNEETKKKLEASGTTVEAMNDAAKMFLTAQEAITLPLNSLSAGVESVSQWFEENSTKIKIASGKFFGQGESSLGNRVDAQDNNPNSEGGGESVVTKDVTISDNFNEAKKNIAIAKNAPVISQDPVKNRTKADLNKDLTSFTKYVKLLEDSVSLNLQGQEKRYTKHIKAMEAELDARKKQEMKDLREERRFDSGT